MSAPYHVLLYYSFAKVEDPAALQKAQLQKCLELDLRGRIIVAPEGLNGTVSGSPADCKAYMDWVHADPRFAQTDFKVDEAEEQTFLRINVRIKPEIVHAGLPEVKPYEQTGTHLTPAEWKAMMHDPDVVLLDVRSNYEHNLGHFKGAVRLPIDNFREFPEHLAELENLKDKKILTYCTGGIKCEKASAFLIEQGFENVYQLLGGIIRYGIEENGEDFDGKCYVFDNRVAIDVNTVNPTAVAVCYVCGTKTERMVNCANPECNQHVTICDSCGIELQGACSEACAAHPKKRPYNQRGYYVTELNGYVPGLGYPGIKRKMGV
jgi:UPF0176 protein